MARKKSPAKKTAKLPQKIEEISPLEEQAAKKEYTRSKIALYYIVGFIVITAGVIVMGAIRGYSIGENKDMLLAVSGVLSGPLGFIIGYYFKGGDE